MSDWEDDDYDPNAQLSEKMVELGLDSKKEPPTTVGGLAGGGKLGGGGKSSAAEYRELTEAEKRAAQLASDSQHTADLFGIDNDRGDGVTSPDSAAGSAVPAVSSLKTRDAFACYGERLGAELASRSDSAFYLDMVVPLVDHLTKSMKKIALETVRDTVLRHLDVYTKKEEAEQKELAEQKQQKQQKKKKSKAIREDLVEDDDMDDFDAAMDKFR